MSTPTHKDGRLKSVLTLPFRESNAYPEVESSFSLPRVSYEEALITAYRNTAFEIRGELGMSPETKREIAPVVLVEKLLNCFGGISGNV